MYRAPEAPPGRWMPPMPKPYNPTKLGRLTCAIVGHDWRVFKVHNALMVHLHATAGCDARCSRCGHVEWWGGTRYDE